MKTINELVKFSEMNVSDFVKEGQKVHFSYYRQGILYYKHDNGLEFPVPIEDLGNADAFAEHKAITLMRYIRKYLEDIRANVRAALGARSPE